MSKYSFYFQLTLLSVFAAVILYLINQAPRFQSYSDLSWISLAFFIGLSIAMFLAGFRATKSENKHNFTNVVMGFTIGKLMLSALIILVYFKLAEPETRLFVIPFFCIYFIYTVFETYFMTRLGRMG